MSKSYIEKLKDPRWQKKRLEILERDNFCCQKCFDDKSTLHVHHKHYTHLDPWDCNNTYLITLCEECHEVEKEEMTEYKAILHEQLMRHFLADDLRELASGFNNLPHNEFPHDVLASMIHYLLSSEDEMSGLWDRFFESLSKRKVVNG